MPDFINVRTALEQGRQILEKGGVIPARLTAEVLLMHAAGQDRAWLYAHALDPLKEVCWIHYGRYLSQRLHGKPAQYITGRQEFYGREFRVTPDVLIPRPETEHLIESVLPLIKAGSRVLDIGAGSGCIAITLALETQARVTATDVSLAALRMSMLNAKQLDANIQVVACDLGSAFSNQAFDVIVSNPPYVPLRDRPTLQHEISQYEPALALFGGEDGSDIYRRLIPEAAGLMKPGGWLVLELGDAPTVHALLEGWDNIEIINDLAGIPRVAVAQRSRENVNERR